MPNHQFGKMLENNTDEDNLHMSTIKRYMNNQHLLLLKLKID